MCTAYGTWRRSCACSFRAGSRPSHVHVGQQVSIRWICGDGGEGPGQSPPPVVCFGPGAGPVVLVHLELEVSQVNEQVRRRATGQGAETGLQPGPERVIAATVSVIRRVGCGDV